MAGIFGEFASGLRLPQNEARKLRKKFGENSEQNSGQNSGRKSKKFGKLSFCNFSDLTFWHYKAFRAISFCRGATLTMLTKLILAEFWPEAVHCGPFGPAGCAGATSSGLSFLKTMSLVAPCG